MQSSSLSKAVRSIKATMKVLIIIVTIFSLVFGQEKLRCLECSEREPDDAKKCSKNMTRYSEATDDINVQCRIWALNGVPVHKALVPSSACTNATLEANIENNILGQFTGDPPAQASCCNWTFCNANLTMAALISPPPNVAVNLDFCGLFTLLIASFVLKMVMNE